MLVLKAFFSPFKRPKLKVYFGKTRIGVPIFYPRKWVKATPKIATEKALEDLKNPNNTKSFSELYDRYIAYSFPVEKKIGFNFCDVGWKTKWDNTDYRFEWNAVFSFVFFGWQFAVVFSPNNCHEYWECFLYYHYNTDKTKSRKERVKQARKEFPCIKTVHHQGGLKETLDYWDLILK